MSDTFVEVTQQKSWMDRMMEAIGGVLFGLALFVLGFPLLAWNEYRSLQQELAIQEGEEVCVRDVKPDTVSNDGKLIHTSGEATTTEAAKDELLGVSKVALKLRREVEMYQWEQEEKKEKRVTRPGKDDEVTIYTYRTAWKNRHEESNNFREPAGHHNPPMEYSSQQFLSPKVTLGAFTLSEPLVEKIPGLSPLPWDDNLRAGLKDVVKNSSKLSGEWLYYRKGAGAAEAPEPKPADPAPEGANPCEAPPPAEGGAETPKPEAAPADPNPAGANFDTDKPEIGDYRIKYEVVMPHVVTIMATPKGDTLNIWQASNTYELGAEVADGTLTADQMFAKAHESNTLMTWILRVVGLAMLVIGLNLIFRPVAVLLDWIPFVGDLAKAGIFFFALAIGLALGFVTIAIAWIAVRPLIGIALLVAAVAVIFGIRYLVGLISPSQPTPAPKMA